MNAFDKLYSWAMPTIPSRDKIYAKLIELKAEQDKTKEWIAHEGCYCELCKKARGLTKTDKLL